VDDRYLGGHVKKQFNRWLPSIVFLTCVGWCGALIYFQPLLTRITLTGKLVMFSALKFATTFTVFTFNTKYCTEREDIDLLSDPDYDYSPTKSTTAAMLSSCPSACVSCHRCLRHLTFARLAKMYLCFISLLLVFWVVVTLAIHNLALEVTLIAPIGEGQTGEWIVKASQSEDTIPTSLPAVEHATTLISLPSVKLDSADSADSVHSDIEISQPMAGHSVVDASPAGAHSADAVSAPRAAPVHDTPHTEVVEPITNNQNKVTLPALRRGSARMTQN